MVIHCQKEIFIIALIVIFLGANLYSVVMDFSVATMKNLAELLKPPEEDVIQGDNFATKGFDITSTRNTSPQANRRKPRTIEEYEEEEAKEIDALGQGTSGLGERKIPEYTMNYQQSVSAEDVYLQIGPKTPASASCENLIVKVKMPGDKKENVDLAVNKTSVVITSSQYMLKLPLPHEIDPDRSKANWDSDHDILQLTLKLDREFDFVNF